jgi:hypothetical protein
VDFVTYVWKKRRGKKREKGRDENESKLVS